MSEANEIHGSNNLPVTKRGAPRTGLPPTPLGFGGSPGARSNSQSIGELVKPYRAKDFVTHAPDSNPAVPQSFGGVSSRSNFDFGEVHCMVQYDSVFWQRPGECMSYMPSDTAFVQEARCEKFTHLGASYYQSSDVVGYFYEDSDGTKVQFTNFILTIKELQHEISFEKEDNKEFYLVCLKSCSGRKYTIKVAKENWVDLLTQIERKCPECQVFVDVVSGCREKFKRLSGILLGQSHHPVKSLYKRWGWGEQLQDGRRVFYHGGRDDCISPKCLPDTVSHQTAETLKEAFQIFDVGPLNVMAPIVMYNLAAYTDALFTDAGYPLAHAMMLVGDSGFLKTAVSKVLVSPFDSLDERLYSIRGTEASFAVLHQKAFDDVLGVDDFNHEGTSAEVSQKLRLMRNLIRAYSDKTPRTKYSGQDSVRQYAIRGGCLFTGETAMTGQLKSSELRYVKIVFERCLDGPKLRKFQDNPRLVQVLYATFIRYLELHYVDLVEWIKSMFPTLREKIQISEHRMRDVYIQWKIVLSIFVRAISEHGVWKNQGEAVCWEENITSIFFSIISSQNAEAQVHEPYLRYLEEVFNLIGTGKIRLADNIEQYVQSISTYHGYHDQATSVVVLKKDDTYASVMAAFRERGDYLPIGINDVSRKLKEAGLSRCTDGCLFKAPSKIQGRPRMLALIIEQCNKKLIAMRGEEENGKNPCIESCL